jgi:hypothetical protein
VQSDLVPGVSVNRPEVYWRSNMEVCTGGLVPNFPSGTVAQWIRVVWQVVWKLVRRISVDKNEASRVWVSGLHVMVGGSVPWWTRPDWWLVSVTHHQSHVSTTSLPCQCHIINQV